MSVFERCVSYINNQTGLVLITICLVLTLGLKRRKNLPPGPLSFPVLGNLPLLVIKLYRTAAEVPEHLLAELAKEYGKVFSLRIGTKLIIVANECASIKEAFKNPFINDRPRSQFFTEIGLDEGLVHTSGKSWKYQRVLSSSSFRAFGVGRIQFETNIVKEAETLVDGIRDKMGKPFDPLNLAGNCVSNVVCSVVFGRRYDHSDPEFQRLILLSNKKASKMGSGGIVPYFPIAKYIFPGKYKDLYSIFCDFKTFIQGHVDEHRRNFDKENMKDIIDVFLNEIELIKSELSDRAKYIHLKSLTATTTFFFLAGTEPTTTTLRWAFLYMIMYPEIQTRVQQEIDTVVGRTRMTEWADRLRLPYTEAVLLEIQRIRTVAPLALVHMASADTKLAGYDIPKGAFVVSNFWALHNDPDVWNEPDQFRPERFLDNKRMLRHREELMPFGTGHRICLGENLAKMEVFLFFTYILHSFRITKPPNAKAPSMKGIGGTTFSPASYQLVAERRE